MTSTKITDYDINKPDDLLDDLKRTVNKTTKHLTSKTTEKDVGIDYGLLEPQLNGIKTIRTETSTADKPSSRSVLGSPSLVRKVMNESKTRGQSPTPKEREIKFDKFDQSPKLTRDVKFETEPMLHSTPNGTTTRTYNYSKTTSSTRNTAPYKTQIVEMDTTDLPAELKNAPISSDLLPQPGTKITETIKTYSYQIPDDKKVPENVTFKNEYYNSEKASNSYHPDIGTPPEKKKIFYTSETRTSSNHIAPPIADTVKPYQTKYYYKKEVNETKNNVYAPQPTPTNETIKWYERNDTKTNDVFHPPSNITSYTQNLSQNDNLPPGTKQTYLYKKESTNTTNTVYEPPPPLTPTNETITWYERNDTKTNEVFHPPSNITSLPTNLNQNDNPPPGTKQTYLYKKETTNTTNTVHEPPPPITPTNETTTWYERNDTTTNDVFHPPSNITSYTKNLSQNDNPPPGIKQTYLYKKETTNTTNTVYEPSPPPEPKTEKYYKYSSSTTTKNTHNGPEREIIRPFPTEGIQPTKVDGPPKNLNQLMSTFEEEPVNVDEEPYTPRKEINTALATNPPSKNVAGPPVYYPPGKELFAKSEAQGALRARGATGKGSGMYEYEAESKSKKASKSGAAVVPVCLPLCCAMPCSIM